MSKRKNSILVPVSLSLIILSVVLFITGMILNGLKAPSAWFLLPSFLLLAATAAGLTVTAARVSGNAAPKPAQGRRTVQHSEETVVPAPASGPEADPSTGLITESAGELRTAVGAIQEELEDIRDEEVPADNEHLQTLLDETDRLKKIIEGMEQLSKAQALARSLNKQSIELAPLLNGIVEKTRLSAHNPAITFSLECAPGLAMTADPHGLSRILENLMDNAAKAVRNAGSVTLAAALSGDEMIFTVSDTGIGIKPKQLPHLYERFFRGAGSGIGMGLAIVKELVNACGGKIEVTTRPGEGSAFTVRMPAA